MTISLSEHEKAVEAAYWEGYHDGAVGYHEETLSWLISESRAALPKPPSPFTATWTGPYVTEAGVVA